MPVCTVCMYGRHESTGLNVIVSTCVHDWNYIVDLLLSLRPVYEARSMQARWTCSFGCLTRSSTIQYTVHSSSGYIHAHAHINVPGSVEMGLVKRGVGSSMSVIPGSSSSSSSSSISPLSPPSCIATVSMLTDWNIWNNKKGWTRFSPRGGNSSTDPSCSCNV